MKIKDIKHQKEVLLEKVGKLEELKTSTKKKILFVSPFMENLLQRPVSPIRCYEIASYLKKMVIMPNISIKLTCVQ